MGEDSFGLGDGAIEEVGINCVGDEYTSVVCRGVDGVTVSGLNPSGSGGWYTSFRRVEAGSATARPAGPPFFGFFARSFVNWARER